MQSAAKCVSTFRRSANTRPDPTRNLASIRPQEPMRYIISIASIRKSAVDAATNPLQGMFAAARQAESATVGKLFPGAADGLKNL